MAGQWRASGPSRIRVRNAWQYHYTGLVMARLGKTAPRGLGIQADTLYVCTCAAHIENSGFMSHYFEPLPSSETVRSAPYSRTRQKNLRVHLYVILWASEGRSPQPLRIEKNFSMPASVPLNLILTSHKLQPMFEPYFSPTASEPNILPSSATISTHL